MYKPRDTSLSALPSSFIRKIEQKAYEALPSFELMARAGRAAAELALQLAPASTIDSPSVIVLAGPGNNGGDGLVMATHLYNEGWDVTVYALEPTKDRSPDSARAMAQWLTTGQPVHPLNAFVGLRASLPCSLIVDALFGIGFKVSTSAAGVDLNPAALLVAQTIEQANRISRLHRIPLLALDCPSGLDADTGHIGDDCIQATHTLTFIAAKPGLFTAHAADQCGAVSVTKLGLDGLTHSFAKLAEQTVELPSDASMLSLLPHRPNNSHKGHFGDVLVIGGDAGMGGAPTLAARMALHSGCGRVFLYLMDNAARWPYDPMYPEIMIRSGDQLPHHPSAVVIGPGMGTTDAAKALISSYLTSAVPLVIDADALNLIAIDTALRQQCAQRTAATVITPHPLEAARLLTGRLDADTQTVQTDRLHAARRLARELNAVTVLKGAGTVIAAPIATQSNDAPTSDVKIRTAINLSGTSALATGGTGDVLAGLIGSLLAQGLAPFDAAQLGTWLHGRSVEPSAEYPTAPLVINAGAVINRVQSLINQQ